MKIDNEHTPEDSDDSVKIELVDDTSNGPKPANSHESEPLIVCASCGDICLSSQGACSSCGQKLSIIQQNDAGGNGFSKKNLRIVLPLIGLFLLPWALSGNDDKQVSQYTSSGKKSVSIEKDTFYFSCSNGTKSLPYAVDILPGETMADLKRYGRKRCAEESGSLNKIYKKNGDWSFDSQTE